MNFSSITPLDIQKNWSSETVKAALFCIKKWYSADQIRIYCDIKNDATGTTLKVEKISTVKKMIEKIADELNISPLEENVFEMISAALIQKNTLEAHGLMKLITDTINSITERSHLQDLDKPIEEVLTYTFKIAERSVIEGYKIATLGDLLLKCEGMGHDPSRWNFQKMRWFGEKTKQRISDTIAELYGLTLPLSNEQKQEIREYRNKKE